MLLYSIGPTEVSNQSASLQSSECMQNGNGKWYFPPGSKIPGQLMDPTKASNEHKVKGFANDLTVIFIHEGNHQSMLSCTDTHCKDVCLSIQPDKCYSLVYDRKKSKKNITFKVGSGETQNICNHPTMFVGSTMCYSR